MNHYLDLGVVQIQQWLGRTQKLRGRRGASTMIREATNPTTVTNLIRRYDGAVRINPESGAVDGVINLRVLTDDENVVASVERDLLGHLRRSLPMAALQAVEYHATSYAERGEGTSRHWLAAVHEWPLARSCEWCRSSPGHRSIRQDEKTQVVLCVDCLGRHRNAGTAHGSAMSGPERELLALVGDDRPVPDETGDLARSGLGGPNDNTHLATVYADGNALGRFVREVRRLNPEAMVGLPDQIQHATWQAVRSGLTAIDTGQPTLPIIAHLVGGDDILVTVPAHGAWDFVDAMTSTFAEALDGVVAEVTEHPTLSAAVVVHHKDYPLSAIIDLAGELLRTAKKSWPGQAALAWQSITHEGPTAGDRPVLPLSRLRAHRERLTALAALPASQRQQLARLVREGLGPDLDRQAERLGFVDVITPFRRPDADSLSLPEALDMVRWWRR